MSRFHRSINFLLKRRVLITRERTLAVAGITDPVIAVAAILACANAVLVHHHDVFAVLASESGSLIELSTLAHLWIVSSLQGHMLWQTKAHTMVNGQFAQMAVQ